MSGVIAWAFVWWLLGAVGSAYGMGYAQAEVGEDDIMEAVFLAVLWPFTFIALLGWKRGKK